MEHDKVEKPTELVTHIRDLVIAGGFFIETTQTIASEQFSGQLLALGEYYLMLSVALTRGNANEEELVQVQRRTNELVSLKCAEPLAQQCCKIAEQILRDMQNL